MSISAIPSSVSVSSMSALGIKNTNGSSGGVSFKETLNALGNGDALQMPKSLAALEQKVMRGAPVSSGELLSAQINIHQFNLKVELVSKAVEGFTSSVKRVQQQN